MNNDLPPSENLKITTENGILVLHPKGDIRVRGVIGLRGALEELADNPGYPKVVVDLSRVTFIDSSGIGLLTNFAKRLDRQKVVLYLSGADEDLKELLEMAGIDQAIPLVSSIEEIAPASER